MLGHISCDELKTLIEHEPDSFVLIDVREQQEWDRGHIPGAIHIPIYDLEKEIDKVVPMYDTKVIINCFSGGRSEKAGNILDAAGYTDVYSLDGGFRGYCHLT